MISATAKGTNNVLAARQKLDVSDRISLLDPNNNALVKFIKDTPKEAARSFKFSWFEGRFEPTALTLDTTALTALGSAVTTFDVVSGEENYVQKGDVIMVPGTAGVSPNQWNECLLVTGYSSGTVTVIRNFGLRTSAYDLSTILVDTTCYIVGTVFEEGSAAASPRAVKDVEKYNYTEIFKDAYEVTGTEQATDQYGPQDREKERAKKALKHQRDIERAFIQGQRKRDTTSGTHPINRTSGLMGFITSNISTAIGNINYSTLLTILKTIFRYGDSQTRLALCGGTAMNALALMADSKLNRFQSEEVYKVLIRKMETSHGNLNCIHHKVLDDMGMGGSMIIVDLATCTYKFLQGRDTTFEPNIQVTGQDTMKDQFMTECGMKMELEEQSGLLEGITGFAA